MKKNCQIANVEALAEVVAGNVSNELGYDVAYKTDSCYLEKDGTFHFVMMDRDSMLFSIQRTFSANELAYMVNMPLWEVVGMDKGGFDELAILFFEEN